MSYNWNGMIKINYEDCLTLFDNEIETFLLYDDNTEAVTTSRQEIYKHYNLSGEFGIENVEDIEVEQ